MYLEHFFPVWSVIQHEVSPILICVLLHRLVGLVVKASASRAGGPGFESR